MQAPSDASTSPLLSDVSSFTPDSGSPIDALRALLRKQLKKTPHRRRAQIAVLCVIVDQENFHPNLTSGVKAYLQLIKNDTFPNVDTLIAHLPESMNGKQLKEAGKRLRKDLGLL